MSQRQAIKTDKAPAAIGSYSQGTRAGNLLFISGQLPIDPATGKIVEGSIGDMTRRSLENVKAIIESAGGAMKNLVKVNVYITDMAKFADVNKVYAEFFSEEPPARAVVSVKGLPLGAEIEIEGVALLD